MLAIAWVAISCNRQHHKRCARYDESLKLDVLIGCYFIPGYSGSIRLCWRAT